MTRLDQATERAHLARLEARNARQRAENARALAALAEWKERWAEILNALPCQEYGREEIDPETWTAEVHTEA